MESNTKMQTAGVICAGIMKVLWYLLIAAGLVLYLMVGVIIEAAKPSKNKNYC